MEYYSQNIQRNYDLRAKFEKSKETGKLKMLEEINTYIEELEKSYTHRGS